MKFIKVKATSSYVDNEDDTSSATFYLNTDMIKIITLDGSVYLKTIESNSDVDILQNGDVIFSNIKVHPDSLNKLMNDLQ